MEATSSHIAVPTRGQIVQVRQRRYLVEDVIPGKSPAESTLVTMSCVDDDAQGQALEALWENEVDAQILEAENWLDLGKKRFDDPDRFAAYINTVRWNAVTASNPNVFLAPFRAGIKIDAYQLEPLRKALLLPRVNLFIADDVGLGKTIEAGLIARELLLRRRVREIVVACPPSMLDQWQEELETRFGLSFQILDRAYIAKVRQQQGYGVNPWNTHSRFLISQRLLIDPEYQEPLHQWLGELRAGTLLILDEAHHAAPSSGAKYAIDTKITRAIRDLAPRFEHRLFLSATPHNGHSNSFSALLEILDPQRFIRGVPIKGKKHLEAVMVRRLKDDLREVAGGFPRREVVQEDIVGLPTDAPELALSNLLDQYRQVKEQRFAVGKAKASGDKDEKAARRAQATAGLLISGLQQRLLSSIDAFARTLILHRATVVRHWEAAQKGKPLARPAALATDMLGAGTSSDDEKSILNDKDREAEEDRQIEAASAESLGQLEGDDATQLFKQELALLDQMERIAQAHRREPDAKVRKLIRWISERMCKGLNPNGKGSDKPLKWEDTRILIFTEYDDTRRYLENCLREAIYGTDKHEDRIGIFHGPTPDEARKQLKAAFNGDPAKHPIRILICTDAGREGLNFQLRCHNLFHFDVPWNPGRLEQRNGRIDRKLQPEPTVYCRYFVYTQRPEDRVLVVLIEKTKKIKEELGSLSEVLESRLEVSLKGGIRHKDADAMSQKIKDMQIDGGTRKTVEEEFEEACSRREDLKENISKLDGLLDSSRKWMCHDEPTFKAALTSSLDMLDGQKLAPAPSIGPDSPPVFTFPALDKRKGADPTWTLTLDSLRPPRQPNQKPWEWRKETELRPVAFQDLGPYREQAVQLHLEHPLARRLLSRFSSQGFIQDDLSRACLAQSQDGQARVILVGRLCLYGPKASRLHEEPIYISALWTDPAQRKGKLAPEAGDDAKASRDVLDAALTKAVRPTINEAQEAKLKGGAAKDVTELLPSLERRGEAEANKVTKLLEKRGEDEAKEIIRLLEDQRKRIQDEVGKEPQQMMLDLNLNPEEKRQYESNRKYWAKRLLEIERELKTEPDRIRDIYRVQARRIEPVGLVYLWPEKG